MRREQLIEDLAADLAPVKAPGRTRLWPGDLGRGLGRRTVLRCDDDDDGKADFEATPTKPTKMNRPL